MITKATTNAFKALGFVSDEVTSIWKIVAAILHLGNISFKSEDDTIVIANRTPLQHVSKLLQVTEPELTNSLTQRVIAARGDLMMKSHNVTQAEFGRDALAKAIYDRLFTWIINRINKSIIVPGQKRYNTVIGVLDIYGFEIFDVNSFEQFCINYCNEKLQQLFIKLVLKQEQEEYNREGIEWTNIEYLNNQIKDVTLNIKKALEELKTKSAEKFDKTESPTIHLDSDGTEIDDEDYFQTLENNAELIAVFPGEQWMDPTHYVTITTRRESSDMTDSCDVERVHLKKIVGQLRNNVCNVSVLSDSDLEMLSNMDPTNMADITGIDFIEQLKEVSGRNWNRLLHEKREAVDAIELLKLFAKHRGISIDVEHHHGTSTITTSPATYDDNKQQQQQQQQQTIATNDTNATTQTTPHDNDDGTMSANI